MSAQFTASGYPKHAGTESPVQAGALHREGEQNPADFMDTSLQGSVDQAVGQARARTHLPTSISRDWLHMGSAAASSSGVNHVPEELFSTQRLPGILYTLHLPFPSHWRVGLFSGLVFFFFKLRCFKSNILVHLWSCHLTSL